MGFIIAFWVIAIYVVLCAVFAQSLPLTIIVSIVWIVICVKIAFLDDKAKKDKLTYRVIAFIFYCSLTALPLGLSISKTVEENEHKANKCIVSTCDRERENERNSYYCYRHTCRYRDCTNYKEWREGRCEEHKPHTCNSTLKSTISPTCTKEGKNIYTCDICGEEKEEIIQAKGHALKNNMCSICLLKQKQYKITVYTTMLSNEGVGNEWTTYVMSTDKDNNKIPVLNNATYYSFPNTYVKAYCCASESDESYSDSGGSWVDILFIDGFQTKTTFYVYEDRGQNARSKAKWQFIISVNEV